MACVKVSRVTKVFASGAPALDDVSLEVADGEFMVLVGPSGCGKTTLLRVIAGLEHADYGSVSIDGVDITTRPARDRDVAMVFQDYALYPYMSVRENIGFSLKLRRTPRQAAARRVEEVAKILGIEHLLERRPSQLSGGQRQRVAMGRALVREPKVFLMDEPLSNLDAKLRSDMRVELARMRDRLRRTTIFVTHDQTEAMTLGHRVVVLRSGRVQQIDTPKVLYSAPCNVFVAAFIGSPTMNFVRAGVRDGSLHFGGFSLPTSRPELKEREGSEVILGLRPSAFEAAEFATSPGLEIEVKVDLVEEFGDVAYVSFNVDEPTVSTDELLAASEHDSEEVQATTDSAILDAPAGMTRFVARVNPSVRIGSAGTLRLAVNAASAYAFDPLTGHAIGSQEA